MADYIFFMRGGDARTMNLSESEMNAHMQDWKVYMEGLGAAGKLRGGAPLGSDGVTLNGGENAEQAGSAGGDAQVNGYILLVADSLDEAKNLAQDCPIFAFGGSLEIRECLDMGN